MTDTLPEKFEDLGVKELRRSALEDFAVAVDEKDNKATVLAALAESGVTWSMYVEQHPEVKPQAEDVITSPNVPGESTRPPAPKPGKVITAQKIEAAPEDQFLIKMERENVRYDTRGYTFTKDAPFALVRAKDADFILEKEEGFRMATPSELREYYG